jgi:hypothetical protein
MKHMKCIGKFEIARDIIEEYPDAVKGLMVGLIVVRAEMIYYPDSISYTAIGDIFPEVEAGCIPPEYPVSKRLTQFNDPDCDDKMELYFEMESKFSRSESFVLIIQLVNRNMGLQY